MIPHHILISDLERWAWRVDCSVGKELGGWSQQESCCQQLSVHFDSTIILWWFYDSIWFYGSTWLNSVWIPLERYGQSRTREYFGHVPIAAWSSELWQVQLCSTSTQPRYIPVRQSNILYDITGNFSEKKKLCLFYGPLLKDLRGSKVLKHNTLFW